MPVDGSAGSDKAVRLAVSLAQEKETEIILLNVQPSYNTPNVKRFFSQEQLQAFREEQSKEVFKHELEITQSYPSIVVRTLVRLGDPGQEICEEAKESTVDFIVMGYRGLGAVKRAILGSVATQVLHETDCPVMIVP